MGAECVKIGECSKEVYSHLVYCKISDDIAVDSESKILLTRTGRCFSFRHYKSSKMIFYLEIFFNLTGILISGIFETEQSHFKITVCLRYRDLFGIRWRCKRRDVRSTLLRGSMPTGEILSPKGSIWIKKRRIQPML